MKNMLLNIKNAWNISKWIYIISKQKIFFLNIKTIPFPGSLDTRNSNMVSKDYVTIWKFRVHKTFLYLHNLYLKNCIHIRKNDTIPSRIPPFGYLYDNFVIKESVIIFYFPYINQEMINVKACTKSVRMYV